MSEWADRNSWRAGDYADPARYTLALPANLCVELESASARARHIALHDLTPQDVPVPGLAGMIEALFDALERGAGFAVLSGLPGARLDRDANAHLLASLCTHLGRVADQNAGKKKIEDIVDRGLPMDEKTRGYMGTHAIGFHTDGADFTALYCLNQSAEGGNSAIASASAVYETIRAERPDVLAILERGFHHHRRGEQPVGEAIMTERLPVFWTDNRLVHCLYNRNPPSWLEGTGLYYTAAETEALDVLDATLARPDVHLSMALAPGEVQLINNYNILHARSAYRDGPGRRRHLLRLWLQNASCQRAGPNIIDLYAPWHGRKRRGAALPAAPAADHRPGAAAGARQ
ncbi:MAG: TauD/TfdA family dioxygenase [Alphaproteobacteria bacterium]